MKKILALRQEHLGQNVISPYSPYPNGMFEKGYPFYSPGQLMNTGFGVGFNPYFTSQLMNPGSGGSIHPYFISPQMKPDTQTPEIQPQPAPTPSPSTRHLESANPNYVNSFYRYLRPMPSVPSMATWGLTLARSFVWRSTEFAQQQWDNIKLSFDLSKFHCKLMGSYSRLQSIKSNPYINTDEQLEHFETQFRIVSGNIESFFEHYNDRRVLDLGVHPGLFCTWNKFADEIKCLAHNLPESLDVIIWAFKQDLYDDMLKKGVNPEILEPKCHELVQSCPYFKHTALNTFITFLVKRKIPHDTLLKAILKNEKLVHNKLRAGFTLEGLTFFVDTMLHAQEIDRSYRSAASIRERDIAQKASNKLLRKIMPRFLFQYNDLKSTSNPSLNPESFTYYLILHLRSYEMAVVGDREALSSKSSAWLSVIDLFRNTNVQVPWLAEQILISFEETQKSIEIVCDGKKQSLKNRSRNFANIAAYERLVLFYDTLNKKTEQDNSKLLTAVIKKTERLLRELKASIQTTKRSVHKKMEPEFDFRDPEEAKRIGDELIAEEVKALTKLIDKQKRSTKTRKETSRKGEANVEVMKKDETKKTTHSTKLNPLQEAFQAFQKQSRSSNCEELLLAFQNFKKRIDKEFKTDPKKEHMNKIIALEILSLKLSLTNNPIEILDLIRDGDEIIVKLKSKEDNAAAQGFCMVCEDKLILIEKEKSRQEKLLKTLELRLDKTEKEYAAKKEELRIHHKEQEIKRKSGEPTRRTKTGPTKTQMLKNDKEVIADQLIKLRLCRLQGMRRLALLHKR